MYKTVDDLEERLGKPNFFRLATQVFLTDTSGYTGNTMDRPRAEITSASDSAQSFFKQL